MGAKGVRRVFSNRNVLVISLTSSLAMFFRMLYILYWPRYLKDELGMTVPQIGLLSTVQQSQRLLFQLPGGILADRLGRKKVTLIGAATRIITPIIYLWSWSFEHLVLGSVFAAMSSISSPAFTAIIAESLPRDQMASGYGVFGMVRRVPSLFTGVIGGILMDTLGYWVGTRICLIGSFIGAVIVFVVRYLFLTETLVRRPGPKPSIKKDFHEVLPLFRGNLLGMQVTSMLSQFASRLTSSLIVIYVTEVIGFSNTQYGLLRTIMYIIGFLTAMPGGMLADRLDRRKLISFARSISPTTIVGYIYLRDFYQVLAVRLVAGVGMGLSGASAMGWLGGAAWSSLLADIIPPEKRGRVSGLMGTISGVTSLPSPYIGAYMWDVESIGPEKTLWATVLLGLVSTLVFWKYVRDPRLERKVEEKAEINGEDEEEESGDHHL